MFGLIGSNQLPNFPTPPEKETPPKINPGNDPAVRPRKWHFFQVKASEGALGLIKTNQSWHDAAELLPVTISAEYSIRIRGGAVY